MIYFDGNMIVINGDRISLNNMNGRELVQKLSKLKTEYNLKGSTLYIGPGEHLYQYTVNNPVVGSKRDQKQNLKLEIEKLARESKFNDYYKYVNKTDTTTEYIEYYLELINKETVELLKKVLQVKRVISIFRAFNQDGILVTHNYLGFNLSYFENGKLLSYRTYARDLSQLQRYSRTFFVENDTSKNEINILLFEDIDTNVEYNKLTLEDFNSSYKLNLLNKGILPKVGTVLSGVSLVLFITSLIVGYYYFNEYEELNNTLGTIESSIESTRETYNETQKSIEVIDNELSSLVNINISLINELYEEDLVESSKGFDLINKSLVDGVRVIHISINKDSLNIKLNSDNYTQVGNFISNLKRNGYVHIVSMEKYEYIDDIKVLTEIQLKW